MGCCWIDLLCQVHQEVEVSVFQVAVLHVFVFLHVLLEVLL